MFKSSSKKIVGLTCTVLMLISIVFCTFAVGYDDVKTTQERLDGNPIAIQTGSMFDKVAGDFFPHSEKVYFNNNTDSVAALEEGTVDAMINDKPYVEYLLNEHPNLHISCILSEEKYGFILRKNNTKSDNLRKELNEFISASKENGLLKKAEQIYFNTKLDEIEPLDYSALDIDGAKELNIACSSETGVPFVYIKDNQINGFDMYILYNFAKEYGYKIVLHDFSFSGIMPSVQSGIDDIGTSLISITEERKESMNFTDYYYTGGSVVCERKSDNSLTETDTDIFTNIANSFKKTFIKESRWILLVKGIWNTVFITLLSIVFGSLLGLFGFLVCKNDNKAINTVSRFLIWLIQGMPVVVLLMILFYIVFKGSGLDGVWISIIGFSLIFASSVFGIIKTGVGAIDNGQYEAAFALGFGSQKTFFKIILPQAAKHILPIFRSEVVALIKATAVVGYIAVQDLTKIGDIIRSRTYEAFFPLIAVAIIYFLIETLLIIVINKINRILDSKKNDRSKVLKGIITK